MNYMYEFMYDLYIFIFYSAFLLFLLHRHL